ncbi:MAG: PAS domain-containing protein, partial [Enterobacterales bacterium]|nr:PAS domain-containing protein [Enterobacterales bacterium]
MPDDAATHSYLKPLIRVLHVEDSRTDIILIKSILKKIPTHKFDVVSVDSLEEAVNELKKSEPDVILLDLTVTDSSGIETVERMRDAAPLSPIVVTTGNDSQLLVQTAMRKGAQDYLFKNNINQDVLNRAICNAIDRKIAENENEERRLTLEAILGGAVVGYWDWDIDHASMYISPEIKKALGYEDDELENNPGVWQQHVHPQDQDMVINNFKEHVSSRGELLYEHIARLKHKDGHYIAMGCRGQVIKWDESMRALRIVGC